MISLGADATTLRIRRECIWCAPSHVIEEGDPGAPILHGMCPVAEVRELAKMAVVSASAREAIARHRAAQAMYAKLHSSRALWFDCGNTATLQRLFAIGLAAYQEFLDKREP